MAMRVNEFELAQWLIKNKQLRIVHQRACQGNALRHAARQLVRMSVFKSIEADELQRFGDATTFCLQVALRLWPKRRVAPDRAPGVERGVLEHDHARWMRARYRLTIDEQVARGRRLQAGHEPQQR